MIRLIAYEDDNFCILNGCDFRHYELYALIQVKVFNKSNMQTMNVTCHGTFIDEGVLTVQYYENIRSARNVRLGASNGFLLRWKRIALDGVY